MVGLMNRIIAMTKLSRAKQALAALSGLAAAAAAEPAMAQPSNPTQNPSVVTGPSLVRPEFTRPAGIPGASRSVAGSDSQYMIAPAQPSAPAKPPKRKRRK